jgi:hypothetical protein
LDRGRRDIQRFSEDSHRSFLHVGSEARSFHKTLEGLTEQAPILGRAMVFAINPVVGIFTALAAGIAYGTEKLKEFNKHLDDVRDRNAGPLTNAEGIQNAVRNRVASVAEQKAEFERSQRGKVPILNGLNEFEQSILQGMPAGPQRDAIERSYLEAARSRVMSSLGRNQIGLEGARGAAANPALQATIERRKQIAAFVRKQMEDIEKRVPALQEQAATPTGLPSSMDEFMEGAVFWLGRLVGRNIPNPYGADREGRKTADEELSHLQELRRELKKLEDELRALTAIDKSNTAEVKNKEEAVSKLIDSIAELDKEYKKIPGTPAIGRTSPGIMIDPETGGIAYRPITDTGGIAYRPGRGAPGFMPIVPKSNNYFQPDDTIAGLNAKMAVLVNAAIDTGLVLKLPP